MRLQKSLDEDDRYSVAVLSGWAFDGMDTLWLIGVNNDPIGYAG